MRIKELFQESGASDLSNLGRRVAPKLMGLIHREIEARFIFHRLEAYEWESIRFAQDDEDFRSELWGIGKISDLFQPKELRELYEPLKDVDVVLEVNLDNINYGQYWEQIRRVEVNVASVYKQVRKDYPTDERQREINMYRAMENTLIHEIRHALDHYYQLHGEFYDPNQPNQMNHKRMPGYRYDLEWADRSEEIMAELSQVLRRVNKEMEYYALEKNIVFDFESYLNDVTSIMVHRFPKLGFRSDSGDPEFYKPFIKKVYKTFDYEMRRLRRMTDDEEVKREIDIQLRKQPQ
jgi:hypothetical protein